MNRNSFSRENRVARQVSVATLFLFCLYSFFFLMQGFGDQLHVMGSEYSRLLSLRVPIAPWLIALVMVLVLQGIQVLLKSIFRIETRFLILSYLPSFCGLLMCIWVSDTTFDERTMYTNHLTVSGFLVLLLVLWITKYLLSGNDQNALRDPQPNLPAWRAAHLFLFALCFFVVGVLSPMKQTTRNEAAMMQAVRDNQLARVLEMDLDNRNPSLKMTQLRNQALLQGNLLGGSMFTYPQTFGIKGIEGVRIPGDQSSQAAMKYELRMARLLLEKNLTGFIEELANYAQCFSGDELPSHYKEAYAYYVYAHPEKPYLIQDTELRNRFVSYLKERNKYRTEEECKTALAATGFGATYWWYYEYINPKE